jgi:hypothetical protein
LQQSGCWQRIIAIWLARTERSYRIWPAHCRIWPTSLKLDNGNQTAEALKLVQEAVAIRRDLFKTDLGQGIVLAGSLSQQANWLAAAGRVAEAGPVFDEEAATYRALVDRTRRTRRGNWPWRS